MLAGLPQAPSIYDPFHSPQAALDRRDEVLRAMLSNGALTLRQYDHAVKSNTLGLKPGRIYTRIKQPYFFSYVIDELEREYGANTVREGGLKVYTTIDPRLQRNAVKAIRDVLPYKTDPASAIVSVEPGTGAIRAMTAVVRSAKNQFNLAAQSARQAGSTFKTFVLASAIEQGVDPDSTYYTSAPFTCSRGPWCQEPYSVHTYGNDYHGSMSLTRATLSSDNTVYAQLTLDVGPRYVWQMAHRLGVHMSPDTPVASIGLGSLAVSPLDMAAAYATFAAMGIYAKPMAITKVILPGEQGRRGQRLGQAADQARGLSEGVAWKVNDVLRQNALYGTGAGSSDGLHPNAGKTGTTENHADAWFDGYTRQLSTVVWMGYPKGEIPMLNVHGQEVAGATFPVPIWHEYMAAALWHHKVLGFELPNRYPVWRSITRGNYGSFGYTQTYAPTYTQPYNVQHDDDDRGSATGRDDTRHAAAGPHDAEDDDGSGAASAARDDHAAAAGDDDRPAARARALAATRVARAARPSARRARAGSPARGRRVCPLRRSRVRSSSSAASRVTASASACGSSGGTSSADSPSTSSSRAATVSAVITGAPVESASKTAGGIARDSRKLPSTMPACATAMPSSLGCDLVAHRDPHGDVRLRLRRSHDVGGGVGEVDGGEGVRRRPGLAEQLFVGPEEHRLVRACAQALEVAPPRRACRRRRGRAAAARECRRRAARSPRRSGGESADARRRARPRARARRRRRAAACLRAAALAARRSAPGSRRSRCRRRGAAARADASPPRRR